MGQAGEVTAVTVRGTRRVSQWLNTSTSLREMELMIGLPWHHFNPASTMSNFEEFVP